MKSNLTLQETLGLIAAEKLVVKVGKSWYLPVVGKSWQFPDGWVLRIWAGPSQRVSQLTSIDGGGREFAVLP